MQLKSDAAYKGKQEDAEELLLAILNGLHEEMIAVLRMGDSTERQQSSSSTEEETQTVDIDDDSEWIQVVTGRKHPIARQVSICLTVST